VNKSNFKKDAKMREKDNVDITRMADVTGISEAKIKLALGLFNPCWANTIREAMAIYYIASIESEEEMVAFERWNELTLRRIEEATTIEEIKTACYSSPSETETEIKGFKKWAELATTIKEIKEVYNAAPDRSEAKSIAFKKWNKLALQKVDEATTLVEAMNAYDDAPEESEAELAAIRKLATFFMNETKT